MDSLNFGSDNNNESPPRWEGRGEFSILEPTPEAKFETEDKNGREEAVRVATEASAKTEDLAGVENLPESAAVLIKEPLPEAKPAAKPLPPAPVNVATVAKNIPEIGEPPSCFTEHYEAARGFLRAAPSAKAKDCQSLDQVIRGIRAINNAR